MSGVQRSAKISAPRETGQNWPYSGTCTSQRRTSPPRKFIVWAFAAVTRDRSFHRDERHLGGTSMRQIGPVTLALVLVTCGGAPSPAASSATPPASPSATVAAIATPTPTYAPSAEGFNSKLLVEKPRNISTTATGYAWIVAGATTEESGVSAVVSERESFTASYKTPAGQRATDGARFAYATPDIPPLAAGRYTESLRFVVIQTGGRSAAHLHSRAAAGR